MMKIRFATNSVCLAHRDSVKLTVNPNMSDN